MRVERWKEGRNTENEASLPYRYDVMFYTFSAVSALKKETAFSAETHVQNYMVSPPVMLT
jgi:hypothetical protein